MSAPALPRPILLLINGHARSGQRCLEEAAGLLRAAGVNVRDAQMAPDRKGTEKLLRREVEEGASTVIIGGGDGTLSTCAEYLVHTNVAMGILPLGTGNTFARSVGIPVDLKSAVQTIAGGHVEAVDVGRVNRQIFLNSVALGFSTELAEALTRELKSRLGLFAWPYAGARLLLSHRPVQVRLTHDGQGINLRTHQLLIANGRYVAGPILASPDASVQDSELMVLALGGARKGRLFKAALDWVRHRHHASPDVRCFETQKLRVESLRRPLRANVDGDVNEKTPLDLEVLPRALRVVVPKGFVADEV